MLPNSKKQPSIQRRVASPKSESAPTRIQSGPKERTKLLDENLNELKRSNSLNDVHQGNQGSNLKKDQDLIYYEQNILPLLKQMELNALHKDTDALLVNFDMLWKTLEIGNMLGKSKLGSKRRTYILSTAYKCTASDDSLLLLKLCKLFIAVSITLSMFFYYIKRCLIQKVTGVYRLALKLSFSGNLFYNYFFSYHF